MSHKCAVGSLFYDYESPKLSSHFEYQKKHGRMVLFLNIAVSAVSLSITSLMELFGCWFAGVS